jgi:hypothetical protein
MIDRRCYQLSHPTDTEQKFLWRRDDPDGPFWTLEVVGDDHILIEFDTLELLKLYQAIQQEFL